jgi:hypothetical protein
MRAFFALELLAVAGLLAALAGCQSAPDYRVMAELPKPVFGEERPIVVPPAPQATDIAAGRTGAAAQTANASSKVAPGQQPRLACPVPDWEKHSADGPPGRGNAAIFDQVHRNQNHWDELGYHFVIGNGTDSRDGLIEVGSRWRTQKHGAHCKTDDNRFNDFGIGICLVGNFDITHPSAAQMASLQKLVSYLAERYDIPTSRILGHREAVATVPAERRGTDCPGRFFDMRLFRQAIGSSRVASAGK